MSLPLQPIITHDTPILVIDDDKPLCMFLVEVLTLEGYSARLALVPFQDPTEPAAAALHALQHADRPTIILADPMTFGSPGTEALTTYIQDEAQRQPHLLILMLALPEEHAANAMTWLHADARIAMPFDMNQMLALIADGERILRERATTPPDPFTIDA